MTTWLWNWWTWLTKPDPRPHSPDESHVRNVGWSAHEEYDEATDEQVAALRKMVEELKKHEHD